MLSLGRGRISYRTSAWKREPPDHKARSIGLTSSVFSRIRSWISSGTLDQGNVVAIVASEGVLHGESERYVDLEEQEF